MTGAGAGGGTRITGVEPRWWWTPSLVSYRVVEIEIVGVHNSQWRTVLLSLHPPALPPCYINARRFCLSLSLRRLPPPHPSPLLGAAPRRAASSASPPRSPTTRPAPTSSRCSQSPPATPPLTPRIPDAESCPSPAAVSSVFSKFRDPAPSPVTPDDAAAAPDEPRDLGFDDDDSFDADSILCGVHQSAAEGIDGIMGKLSMENNGASGSGSSVDSNMPESKMHPYLRNLMVLGLSFWQDQNIIINQALKRHSVDPEWEGCSQPPSCPLAPPNPRRHNGGCCDKPADERGDPAGAVHHAGALGLYESQHMLSTSVLLWSTEGGAGGENFSQFGADLSRRMTYCHRAKDDSMSKEAVFAVEFQGSCVWCGEGD
ncbi:hypothetical protein ZEAMMB73_Zm00001d029722 [Zea mays]|uniref:Uncharacterized protein n=1 Tax=Zea mays TaxID=4577 RepID=A0A1D6K7E9_MAIZE|nr:hypothetical protein ZEAMMB73_Zm00001d029722 [Zea mays]